MSKDNPRIHAPVSGSDAWWVTLIGYGVVGLLVPLCVVVGLVLLPMIFCLSWWDDFRRPS